MRGLVIVGDGETAALAYEYVTCGSDYEVVAFAVEPEFMKRTEFLGLPVVPFGTVAERFPPDRFDAFVALGSGRLNAVRTRLVDLTRQRGYRLASVVGSRAAVWRNVRIGVNCFIQDNCTVQPFATIGDNVTLWSGTFIGHRTVVEDNAFIGANATIAGFGKIGRNSFLGINCAIADHVEIGADNYIAMSTPMTRSSPRDTVWKGNPAARQPVSATDFCRLCQA